MLISDVQHSDSILVYTAKWSWQPSERSGEKVKAFIVKKHKSLTEEMILTMCKKHLTAYKVPKEIEFIDSMPKTAVGKVKR